MAHLSLIIKVEDEASVRYLDASARIRQVSRTRLLQLILGVVLKDQLILSIMDDDADKRVYKPRYKQTKVVP